jgi:hypothetical protein
MGLKNLAFNIHFMLEIAKSEEISTFDIGFYDSGNGMNNS